MDRALGERRRGGRGGGGRRTRDFDDDPEEMGGGFNPLSRGGEDVNQWRRPQRDQRVKRKANDYDLNRFDDERSWKSDLYDKSSAASRRKKKSTPKRQRTSEKKRSQKKKAPKSSKPEPVAEKKPMSNTVVINGLSPDINEEDLQTIFEEVGAIKEITLNYDKDGKSNGTAQIIFQKAADAETAVDEFDRAEVEGQVMYLKLVVARSVASKVVKKSKPAKAKRPVSSEEEESEEALYTDDESSGAEFKITGIYDRPKRSGKSSLFGSALNGMGRNRRQGGNRRNASFDYDDEDDGGFDRFRGYSKGRDRFGDGRDRGRGRGRGGNNMRLSRRNNGDESNREMYTRNGSKNGRSSGRGGDRGRGGGRGGRGNGRGGVRGRGGNKEGKKAPTAESLDAEMDDYFNKESTDTSTEKLSISKPKAAKSAKTNGSVSMFDGQPPALKSL